ncbi:hypothetical protein RirG_147380 [Rhizophagus irregularis DAOM 197198w]|uniref:Uncharacterized protein n=1 Tax=Rhizophagus irregularis (strain DAOM 197198w) TaxID=1432141 RepID=A0A015MAU2_RHIIW|nr:hypothetical protein RirG_147380 [Rhizophagus irregularis DAOM 197198w]
MATFASVFKIIQTSKEKRKLIGYFENWKATLKALDKPQVFLTIGKELKWCQHFMPNLKKALNKPKVKNIPNKKSGNAGQQSGNVNLKKKDHKFSPNTNKQVTPKLKSNKKKKAKGGGNTNKEILAEILVLLPNLV